MKRDSKITSAKSEDALTSSLKRSRTSSELDASPLSLKLAQYAISSNNSESSPDLKAMRGSSEEFDLQRKDKELSKTETEELILHMSNRIHLLEGLLGEKRNADKKPCVFGIRKILGIVKKDGPNKGKLFSCLRGADQKTVAKTFKILDEPLSEVAYVKDGMKQLLGKVKHWKAWFAKENDEMVLGSYSEYISDDEGSTEEAADEC